MQNKNVDLLVSLPVISWQLLVAMAAEDLREPAEFLRWLTHQEAKQRGLVATPSPDPEDSDE